MIPSRRMLLALLVPTVASLLARGEGDAFWAVAGMDLALAFVFGLDAWGTRHRRVEATRSVAHVMAVGRAHPVSITLHSKLSRSHRVLVNDDTFDGARTAGLPASVLLPAGDAAEVNYTLNPTRRGSFGLGRIYIRHPSPLGLWTRQLRLELPAPVQVYPDFQRLRSYDLMARRHRELDLVRAVRRRGGENEFERLRDYTRDDEYRSIDWKATARRRRLVAREYQQESNQTLLFLLDAGRTMTAESQGLSQFDHALNASLMLAHVALEAGDSTGVGCFDRELLTYVKPQSGRRATTRLVRATYDLHPRLVETDHEAALCQIAIAQRKRALVVVFTEIGDARAGQSLLQGIRALSRRHLPMVVMPRDLNLESLLDDPSLSDAALYEKAAAAELLHSRQQLVRDLRGAGAIVVEARPRQLDSTLINWYLEIKAQHWL